MKNLKLLNIDDNAKTILGQSQGYKTALLYLSPSKLAGNIYRKDKAKFIQALESRYKIKVNESKLDLVLKTDLCQFAKTCLKDCLNTAGHGKFDNTQFWRAIKTAFYLHSPKTFRMHLLHEIGLFYKRETKKGFKTAFRFNGTSDLNDAIITKWIKNHYPNIEQYDYTKDIEKFKSMPYNLTYSIQDKKSFIDWVAIEHNGNCALVTSEGINDPILSAPIFESFRFIDGNKTDLRFLDEQKKSIVVLKGKGKAAKSKSKFIVNNWTNEELCNTIYEVMG